MKNNFAEKIFNKPFLYRIKINTVKFSTWLVSKIFMRHKPEPLQIFNKNIQDGDNVLDIGCGDGYVYRYLQDQGKKIKFFGVDINKNMVEYCRQKYPTQEWLCAQKIDFKNFQKKLDVITYYGVLHHMNSFKEICESLRSSLENSNIVMLYEPLQSDSLLLKGIKSFYWRITDGGKFYLTLSKYHNLFKNCDAEVLYEDYSKPLRQIYVAVLTKARQKKDVRSFRP